jgi:ATP-dependent DNA helicase RecQ
MKNICFFDLETESKNLTILDIGGVKGDDATFHSASLSKFLEFIQDTEYLVGHNILKHDIQIIEKHSQTQLTKRYKIIDTLYLSPLLFPSRPYHSLLKDEKILTDELNNPVNDSKKARDLFFDEMNSFSKLDKDLTEIYYWLLFEKPAFKGFFDFLEYKPKSSAQELSTLIRNAFLISICSNANIEELISASPIETAYALSLIHSSDRYSITPPWVLHNFPEIERIMYFLRGKPCVQGCTFCDEALNPNKALKRYFGFNEFRTYGNEPLQKNAVNAAIAGKSLLAVFPTGGGKSITFQVPALMSGENTKGLTVIISPLQSLMKDQVDNLEKKGITDAVTINGLLDPIERSKAIERIQDGGASLLYISPESLRSASIEKLLLGRKIARFVIDEAHCFSSWGQDFRVDYLYIGDFIQNLQLKKRTFEKIPVSCFTATAKQKVIEDIRQYFKIKLDLDLSVFSATTSRTNLQYKVFNENDEEQKYAETRRLLESGNCPTIIYVSRTKRAYKLAERLSEDGFNAKPYHGKMDKEEKTANQNDFISGAVDIMVATSAFGMGVDKSDVGMVIHYDISDSLENYIQEAGRAGRDENITAQCYILFNEEDLDKHFLLLNQTKIDIKEINQVWKAIKHLTRTREKASNSALEIARQAGWEDSTSDIETRVTTAIAALEEAGYVKRGQNMPRVYANSILAKSAEEAADKIRSSEIINESQKEKAIRIIKKLFSSKNKKKQTDESAESRVDYISDHLGIKKGEVLEIIQLLRDEKILADTKDLTAFIKKGDSTTKTTQIFEKYRQLELFLLSAIFEHKDSINGLYNLKELNEKAATSGCKDASPNMLKTLINFWAVKNWISRKNTETSKSHIYITSKESFESLRHKLEKRHFLCREISEHLYSKAKKLADQSKSDDILVEFSILELKEVITQGNTLFNYKFTNEDIEDSLFYLSRIESIKIEGGFLVVYNRLTISRLEKNNRIHYKESDYEKLRQFYINKVQQIHIVGEYAKKMIENYNEALKFVDDYFKLNYSSFLNRYFPGSRQDEIKRTLTPEKFKKLFGDLSPAQLEIIKDSTSQYMLIAAGPGSGKTRVLVHKLASLLLTEDVKHEQLLMLTFSRAAATEFKKRLIDLIGNAAHYVEIKTFHSYCFDLIGRVGSISQSDTVIDQAIAKIRNGDIEASRITKTVLVVDEAQDINSQEYSLLETLIEQNEEMRVVLVGDDDQNIYEFRGSDSKYMLQFLSQRNAKKYDLIENFRSRQNLVSVSNQWVRHIKNRIKEIPIIANDKSDGLIRIVEHSSGNISPALLESIQNTLLSGSTCVLTRTNEEATQINGYLSRIGIPSKLIQTNDGFNLYNLQELRFLSEQIHAESDSSLIDEEEWENSKRALFDRYSSSNKLELCKNLIRDFESINGLKKYKSDWRSYLTESKMEDFITIENELIFVSTIHKTKGKEFDNVYLLLDGYDVQKDESKRLLYVAITRAKKNLTVHYKGSYLRDIVANNLSYGLDTRVYSPIPEQTHLLTHRDVNLGYFEYVQNRLDGISSGISLQAGPEGLATSKGLVVKFSSKFAQLVTDLTSKGHKISAAKVNYVVYWTNPNSGKEVKILLPDITFKRC